MVLAGLAALAPPLAGMPLGAYASVGLLLVGGIAALPPAVGALLQRLAPWVAHHTLPLLALERARRLRETAAVATSGVVASLALSVALTVMVASFRDSVTHWLDTVLPAPLYLRGSVGAGDALHLPPAFVDAVSAVPGVARADPLRALPLQFDPARPPVTLVVRPLRGDPLPLPLVGQTVAVAAPDVPVYASEAMADLYGARLGQPLPVHGRSEQLRFIFLMITPSGDPRIHVRLLSRIASLADSDYLMSRLATAKSAEELAEAMAAGSGVSSS